MESFTQALIVCFFVVGIFYLPRPIYLRVKYFKKVENPQKEALINSLVIGVLLLISGQFGIFLSILYSIAYYFIGYYIIIYKMEEENNIEDEEITENKNLEECYQKDLKETEENNDNEKKDFCNEEKKYCIYCNAELGNDDIFCYKCGKEQLKAKEVEKVYCVKCGKEANKEWKFCKYCGEKID